MNTSEGRNVLREIRTVRSRIWWEGTKAAAGEAGGTRHQSYYRRDDFSRRVNGELVQMWEDPICEVLGIDWRTKLYESASRSEWKQVTTSAEVELGRRWRLPWLRKNDGKDEKNKRRRRMDDGDGKNDAARSKEDARDVKKDGRRQKGR